MTESKKMLKCLAGIFAVSLAAQATLADGPMPTTDPLMQTQQPTPTPAMPVMPATFNPDPMSPAAVPPAAAASADPAPFGLMPALDTIGIGKPFENLGIRLYGHVEAGYSLEFLNRRKDSDLLNGRNFDYLSNQVFLNQATLNIERKIPIATKQWDIGFRVQALDGSDVIQTQSPRSYGAPNKYLFDFLGSARSYERFDIPDAYVDLGIPLGSGLRIRAGRFEFFRTIDPNDRYFYSTTFAFDNIFPITSTGVTAAYNFADNAGIEGGFSRGDNSSFDDDNQSIDFIAKGHFRLGNSTSFTAATNVGPELPGDNHDWTFTVDGTLAQRLASNLVVAGDAFYGHQFGSGFVPLSNYNSNYAIGSQLPGSWWGVSGNVIYGINPYLSLGGRVEYFRNEGGVLSEAFSEGVGAGSYTLYEATFGATITPFPHTSFKDSIKIRPEVRFDYADRPYFAPTVAAGATVPAATARTQVTFGIDLIFNY